MVCSNNDFCPEEDELRSLSLVYRSIKYIQVCCGAEFKIHWNSNNLKIEATLSSAVCHYYWMSTTGKFPYPIDCFPSVLPGFENNTGREMNAFQSWQLCAYCM